MRKIINKPIKKIRKNSYRLLPGQRSPGAVRAASISTTTGADWSAGKYEYGEIDVATSSGDLKLQLDAGTWDATGPASLNHYLYPHNKMLKIGKYMYAFRNRYLGQFMRYDFDTRQWKEMNYLPLEPYEILDATTNNTDTIWVLAARNVSNPPIQQRYFLKYDIPSDTWTYLANTPAYMVEEPRLEYVGNDTIYAIRGRGYYDFWRYTISSNSWDVIQNTTVYCQTYCDLVYDGYQYMYYVTDWGNPDRLYRYDTVAKTWLQRANLPLDGSISTAVDLVMIGNDIYTMRGNSTKTLYKYNTASNQWKTNPDVADTPYYTTYGALAYDSDANRIIAEFGVSEFVYYYPTDNAWSNRLSGPLANAYGTSKSMESDTKGNIYLCRGQNQTTCYKYNVSGNTWTATTAISGTTLGTYGTSLAYYNDAIYMNRGSSGNNIYRYNINTNDWTTAGFNSPAATLGDGSAMTSSGSGTLWAARGGGYTDFYRYDIAGNSWTAKTAVPEAVSRGSGMVQAGMYTYLLQGNQRGRFFRYHETTNSWYELTSLPVGSYYGGGIAYDGGDFIYAQIGGENDYWGRQFYRYSITDNTWVRLADTPAMIRWGGSLVYYSGYLYSYQGYDGAFWRYTPPTQKYVSSGTWYSPIYDLTTATVFNSFTANETKPDGTDIEYYSRTSDDQITWSSWAANSEGNLGAQSKRYLQLKIVLTGDGTASPTLSDFTIDYESDVSGPDTSSMTFSGYSLAGGTALTSGESYNYRNPYFTWTGVSDTESGIEGYYVYFGDNASADVEALGNYQHTPEYTVSTPMADDSTYYLLVKVKDKLGNKSDTVTGFTYKYNGISPATTTTLLTNQADWDNVEATKSGTYSGTSAWWNQSYLYRQQLKIDPADVATPGAIVRIGIDTAALQTAGKLRSDRKDWRVVYWDGNSWMEVDRDYVDATTTHFALQKGIGTAGADTNYYVYYGNANESTSPASNLGNYKSGAKWNGGLSFDGGDYVYLPAGFTTALNGKSTVTIEGWFKYNNPNGYKGVYGSVSGNYTGVGVYSGQNFMHYIVRTSAATYTSATTEVNTYLVPGTWNHVALTYDAATGTAKGFVNGRLDYTKTGMSGNILAAGTQNLGYYNSGYFYGSLDEIRISDNVRYTTDFTPPTSKFTSDSNTIALYHLDDNTGQTVTDSSSNGYNGFLGSNATVQTTDPLWTAYLSAELNASEENAPATAADNSLTLESMNAGSWAGYQISSMPWGNRTYYGTAKYVDGVIYVLRGYNTKTFYKFDTATSTWTQLADAPGNIYNGASMLYDNNGNIYVTQGGQLYGFYKYVIATNTWVSTLTQPNTSWSTGATMVMVGSNTIYAFAGNAQTFLKYTINADDWDNLANCPYTVTNGSGMYYDGNNTIWALAGGTGFFKYTISGPTGDSWDSSLPLVPYYIGYSSNNLIYFNNYLYAFTAYDFQSNTENKRFVWRYNMGTNKWESVTVNTDFWPYVGSVTYDGSRYVYLFQGDATSGTGATAIARFDLVANKFSPETPPLPLDRTYQSDNELIRHQAYTGASLAFDGADTIYFAQGSSAYFNKYQVSTKKWSMMPYIPCTYIGGLVYANNYLYAVCGNTTKLMYRYDPVRLNWVKMADAPDVIGAAGNQIAAFDGTDTIYVIRGRGTRTIYKYSITNNSWDTETNPGASPPDTFGNSMGASINYNDGNLYIFRGNGTNSFYKYTIGGSWSILNSPPESGDYGSGSVYDNGKIYFLSGNMNNNIYVYDVANNVWQYGPQTASPVYAGGALTKGPGNSLYALQGYYTYTFWKYNIPTSTTSYKAFGSHYSQTFDLGTGYGWAGLSATVASPSATSVTFDTRTSTDAASWNGWVEATNLKKIAGTQFTYNINSPVNRYLQVKTTLASDESAETPTVSDISITYYKDDIAPDNPDTLLSYETSTKSAGQTLTDYTWYNKAHPYFEWSGATDATGSGLLGYYVYFGHDESADASLSGSFQETATYSASLTQDGEYFLNIKAKDNAGNVNGTNWSPFHYRYDGTAPNSVGTVSVSPRKYSMTNNFDMSWSGISDQLSNSTSSGLLGYYYQATDSANILGDTYTTGSAVNDVTAYQEGSNTFRVKAKDNAGNETSYTNASFYYNVTPPSAPSGLGVDTSQGGANKFAFSWSEPATYRGSISEYRYSINVFPAEGNISTTSAKLVTNQKGTKQGTNTFYVVAVDEAGNVDYDNYASIDFDVNITAPGIPLNPESFDNSIRNTKSYRVGITWDKPTDMGSAFDRYEIYASKEDTECSVDMDSYALVGTTAGTSEGGSYVVTSMNNKALESTTYHFCVLACSSNDQCSGPSTTVSELPTGRWLIAPEMTATSSATVKTKSASITWTTNRSANSFVKYGTKSGTYGEEVGSSEQVTAHTINLTGLTPGTTYYYQMLWTDEDGNQGSSSEFSFSTNPAPLVSNVKFNNININSAYVTFTIANAIKASIQYGKTLSYGSTESISTSKSESTYTVQLDTLTEGTLYHMRIVGEDDEANTYSSDDYTFETLPTPKISNLKIQQVVGMPTATLRLIWNTNTLTSTIVTYYPTSNPSGALDQVNLALKKNHEVILKNLADNTDYTIIIKGKDSAGNEAKAETRNLKTANDVRAPEIINMNVESTIVGVGEAAKAQIVVTWDTDELGSTQVEYAQGTGANYGQTTQEDTNLTTNHTVTITSLAPAKIYHLRALSKDKAGNVGSSFDTVIITPKSTKDALNLVVENLAKTFGFLNKVSLFK